MNRFFAKSVTVAAVGFSAVAALSSLATSAHASQVVLPTKAALYPTSGSSSTPSTPCGLSPAPVAPRSCRPLQPSHST